MNTVSQVFTIDLCAANGEHVRGQIESANLKTCFCDGNRKSTSTTSKLKNGLAALIGKFEVDFGIVVEIVILGVIYIF
jgi:hypothetical protein